MLLTTFRSKNGELEAKAAEILGQSFDKKQMAF